MPAKPKATRIRHAERRARQRKTGSRLVSLSVPDLGLATLRDEARRQAEAVAASPHAKEDQAFIDAISTGLPG